MKRKFLKLVDKHFDLIYVILLIIFFGSICVSMAKLSLPFVHDEESIYVDRIWYILKNPLNPFICSDKIRCTRFYYGHINIFGVYSSALMVKLFGFSEFNARIPYVGSLMVVIAFTYLLGKSMFNRKVGIISSILCGFYPMLEYGIYMFAHPPAWMLATISSYFYFNGIKNQKTNFIIWGSFFAFISFLNATTGLFIPIIFLVYFLFTQKIRIDKKTISKICIIIIPILLTCFFKGSYTFYFDNPREGNFLFNRINFDYFSWVTCYIPLLLLFLFSFLLCLEPKKHSGIIFVSLVSISLFLILRPYSYNWVNAAKKSWSPVGWFDFSVLGDKIRLFAALFLFNSITLFMLNHSKYKRKIYRIFVFASMAMIFIIIFFAKTLSFNLSLLILVMTFCPYLVLIKKSKIDDPLKLIIIALTVVMLPLVFFNKNPVGRDPFHLSIIAPYFAIFSGYMFYTFSKNIQIKLLFGIIFLFIIVFFMFDIRNIVTIQNLSKKSIELMFSLNPSKDISFSDSANEFVEGMYYSNYRTVKVDGKCIKLSTGTICLKNFDEVVKAVKDFHIKYFVVDTFRQGRLKNNYIFNSFKDRKLIGSPIILKSELPYFYFKNSSIFPILSTFKLELLVYPIKNTTNLFSTNYSMKVNELNEYGNYEKIDISKVVNGNSEMNVFYHYSEDFSEITSEKNADKIKAFDIVDPSKNNGLDIISLRSLIDIKNDLGLLKLPHIEIDTEYFRGKRNISPYELYKNKISVPIKGSAKEILILATAFAPSNQTGKTIGYFTINYADGTSEKIPIQVNLNIDDYRNHQDKNVKYIEIEREDPMIYKAKYSHLDVIELKPSKELNIDSLGVEKITKDDGIAVFGITLVN